VPPFAAQGITGRAAVAAWGIAMHADDVRAPEAWVRCSVCGIEVPLDEAIVPEPTDRLMHLCGLDCYARWRAAAAGSYPALSSKTP
jgi:hypothetical protein